MKARRVWAWPLVPLYWAGLAVKDGLPAAGLLRVRRLGWPVISVGSLSAGGAGKTPVVIALAGLLRERGWYVDVLSRGYGREGSGVERVDAEGVDAARRFGDEPVVIARRVGVPVWVGAERFAAGVAAEAAGVDLRLERVNEHVTLGAAEQASEKVGLPDERWEKHVPGAKAHVDFEPATRPISETDYSATCEALPLSKTGSLQGRTDLSRGPSARVHLLDDGFQHRGLGRAVDVVLVTEADFEDALLPAGNRREPLAALRRADAVVMREEESARVLPRLAGLLREGAAIWTVRRTVSLPAPNLQDRGKGLVAFCAIARPEDFFETLRRAGGRVVHTAAFPDHYRYTEGDIRQLIGFCQSAGGDAFVTTEKDAVKITPEFRVRLEATAPLLVAGLEAAFLEPEDVVRALEGWIA